MESISEEGKDKGDAAGEVEEEEAQTDDFMIPASITDLEHHRRGEHKLHTDLESVRGLAIYRCV